MRRCGCCPRNDSCPLNDGYPEGRVLRNPSGEHCVVIVVGDEVHKYMKPGTSVKQHQERAALAAANPDLFAATRVEGRVVVQQLVRGPHANDSQLRSVLEKLEARGVRCVFDLLRSNVIGEVIVDFALGQERGEVVKTIRRRWNRGYSVVRKPRSTP